MEGVDYKRLAARLICVAFAIAAVYLVFEYALGIVLPFAVAFCLGVPINKLSGRIYKSLHLPKKLCAAVLVLLAFFGSCALLYFGLSRLLSEVEDLVSLSGEDGEVISGMVGDVVDYIEGLSARIPIIKELENIEGLGGFKESIDSGISGLFSEVIDRVTAAVPAFAVEFVKRTPRVIVTIVVSLLACFYFATDYEGIKRGLRGLLGDSVSVATERGAGIILGAVRSYAKAYLLLMLITFIEVFVGLLILGKSYAFIIALGVAIVDVLPLFGTGAVLVPWAVVSFFMGDHSVGVGLLIMYGVITIVRQLIEPRIVGGSLGIHPLATLFSMFAGLTLFGFLGMLLGPLVFIVIREWARGRIGD